MTSYLQRPIFPLPANEAVTPIRSVAYDLRELLVGFGMESLDPIQSHVVRGFEFAVTAANSAERAALESHFDAVAGTLKGFWFVSPAAAMIIRSKISDSKFTIDNIGLAESWQKQPCHHLALTADGDNQPMLCAEIAGVADNDDGSETVTLTGGVLAAIDPTRLNAAWLHYVRFASDEKLELQLSAENYAEAKLKVVELPLEYSVAELGTRKAYGYHFFIEWPGRTQHWRFTSHLDSIAIGAQVFTPFAVTHSKATDATDFTKCEMTVETIVSEAGPFARRLDFTQDQSVRCEVYELNFTTQMSRLLAAGECTQVSVDDRTISTVLTDFADDKLRLPRMLIQTRCGWMLFDGNCGLDRTLYAVEAIVEASDGNNVTLKASNLHSYDDGWFTYGWIESGSGSEWMARDVVMDAAAGTDRRAMLLNNPLAIGSAVTLYQGCNKAIATCDAKFSNRPRHGGHAFVPAKNPSVPQLTIHQSTGKGGK